jgi:hypothetical protein
MAHLYDISLYLWAILCRSRLRTTFSKISVGELAARRIAESRDRI